MKGENMTEYKPEINVTPLIDVLLVLLIIFMIIGPPKISDFKASLPKESPKPGTPNPYTLMVSVNSDLSVELNKGGILGTVTETEQLTESLKSVIDERASNLVAEKTVFIEAPKNFPYGDVVKVIDAVKMSGASPISLKIDGLEVQQFRK
jgi:biopolymer transport protein ExbD